MVTGQQIADTALEAYACNGGYIWGQMGAVWTAAKQKSLEKRYNENPSGMANYKMAAQDGSKWIGHRVWDCAGLCRWAAKEHGLAIHSGSNLIWNCDLAKKGQLTDGMELPVGALVFTGTASKKPHVGVYTGDGLVTEAEGTKAGVVQSKLHGKWKWWGLLKGVTYDAAEVPAEKPAEEPAETRRTLRRGNKGEDVKQVQTMLDRLGYSLGICGIDGDYGTATEKAVKEFQQDHGLTQDGICGPKTYAALDEAAAKLDAKPAEERYTVTVRGLTKAAAQEILAKYGGEMKAES